MVKWHNIGTIFCTRKKHIKGKLPRNGTGTRGAGWEGGKLRAPWSPLYHEHEEINVVYNDV